MVFAPGASQEDAPGFGTPLFFVVDQSARIRFAYSRLEDVPRQVAALMFIDGNRRRLVIDELDSAN